MNNSNNNLTLLLSLVLTLCLSTGLAQTDQVLSDTLRITVEQAVGIAVKNNPELKRAQLENEIYERQVQSAKGAALPQLSAKAGFTDNFSIAQQLLPGEVFGQEGQVAVQFGTRYALNGGLEASQLLYSAEYLSNLRKLGAAKETIELQELASMEGLVYNVVQIYIQHQITTKQREIVAANMERVDQLVTISQAQFDNGIIKKIEVDQIKVNQTNLSSELLNIEIAAEQQLNVIRFYLDLDMNQPLALIEEMDDGQKYPLSPQLLLSENINYQLLDKQMSIAKLENKVINAGYMPTLSAFAQYNYSGQANEFNFDEPNFTDFTSGLWGVNLSIPLFDGFQKKRNLQVNKIKIKQLELDRTLLTSSTQMEFKNATTKILQNEKLVDVQTANMELAQEVYDVTKLSYQEGVAPLTELLNTETSLKEAQSQYLSALLNFKLAELDHIKASGQLAKMLRSDDSQQ